MKQYSKFQKGMVGGMLAISLLTAGAPAPAAAAAPSIADLQAQINQLLAQLQALRNNAPTGACTPFTFDLTTGRTGSDVTRLQQLLIQKGHTIPAGATGYFGEQTRQALVSYQRSENIEPAVGYFGPVTRAKVNATCISTPTNPTNPDNGTPPTNPPLGGEASFRDFDFVNGDDTTLEEGDNERSIGEIEFTVEDGDATLQRVDLVFTPDNANNEKDPWDTFSEVSIWDGNDRIARIDTSRKSAWRDENRTTGAWTVRASGLNFLLEEDSDQKLTVQVSIARNIRGTNDGENWSVAVPNNGIRALDASRVTVETGNASETVALTIDEAGTADEILLRTSSDDPDATTLILERGNRSGFTTVFAFDIDTDDSINDIEIRRLPVDITVSSGTLSTFMRDARITVDGKTYTRKVITDGTTGTIAFEFRSNELVIDAGERVTAEIEIDFKPLGEAFEGTTINGRVVATGIVAEGADDLSSNQLSGTITGDTHRLQTSGAVIDVKNTNAVVTTAQGPLNDYGTFRIEVEVTAINQDVYIPISSDAVTYTLRDQSGNTITASSTAVVSSNAREEGSYFFIPEGQTKTLTLDVTFMPEVALTSARLQLNTIEYAANASAPNQTWSANPVSRFQTNVVTIVN
jgi:peptidoglycan hydrolase-like protein with peptidoglycan-binding domain